MSSCSSIQRDLDRFYRSLNNSDFNIRKVTKSAYSQARKKLNPWAFKRLNEVTVNTFFENNEVYTWHGLRVMAVDGSRIVLPNHPTLKDEFECMNSGQKQKVNVPWHFVLYFTMY